jgi:hypothetical protein
MSLIDLVNNAPNFNYYYGGMGNFTQTSIPFGNDRPGGGSSKQPYVVTPIGSSTPNIDGDTGVLQLMDAAAKDTLRIGSFFADIPKGPLFIAKQVGLQLSNPRLEHKIKTDNDIDPRIGTTRTYNYGLNTLTQVGVQGFGEHIVRHGIMPIYDKDLNYENAVNYNDNPDKDVKTYALGIPSKISKNRLIRYYAKSSEAGYDGIIARYVGGPNSFLGLGTTTIQANQTILRDTKFNSPKNNTVNAPYGSNNSFIAFQYDLLSKIGKDGTVYNDLNNTSNPINPIGNIRYIDFRKIKNKVYGTNLPFYKEENNISTRIKLGDPGNSNQDKSDYTHALTGTQDEINKLAMYYSDKPATGITTDSELIDSTKIRDIIKFRIESIDNDNPAFSIWMIFRAFVTNISYDFTADWSNYSYVGRGEKFYVYNGLTTGVRFDLMFHAQSRQEMKPMWQKINYLASTLAPDYNKNNKMRGSLVKLTMGDMFYRTPGFFTNISYTIENDYSWEIALSEPENQGGYIGDSDMHEIPQMLKASISFVPIYDFLPKKGPEVPFFDLRMRDGINDKKQWYAELNSKLNKDTVKQTQ